MVKCAFCGEDLKQGSGFMYVKVDGTVLHFDRRKCFSYYLMGRDPRNFKWTAASKNG
ncbi:MAG: 50S ribosomal protein L24e [Candidatus Parvarchaeota archaeon]|nr:50S ribosomal protein L24e [Candidatus Parvarchaeota archaeon]MCW1301871.1 50S ribosomal protein L24e [Candidatus Parvarchaeota archaeon]